MNASRVKKATSLPLGHCVLHSAAMTALTLILCIACLVTTSFGFVIPSQKPHCRRVSSIQLSMISLGANNKQQDEFPKDVKDAVSKCRAAVQEALGQRLSRMDIEFPVGAKFGVEKQANNEKKQRTSRDEQGAPTRAVLDTSDRELARLFVEMFQPVGGEHIAVVFSDESLADEAKKAWKSDSTATCRILSTGRSKKKNAKKKKPQGFAAKMEAEVGNSASSGPFALPDGIEVALFVAPGPKELVQVEKTCNKVGMETLVVLLNARLSSIDNFGSDEAEKLFLQDFEPVFSLCAAPQEAAPACLLHRAFPNDWLVARKPKVGNPKVIATFSDRPTEEDCREAYDSIEVGDLEKNVEGVLENVAGWFS